jgi:hypothetical protein
MVLHLRLQLPNVTVFQLHRQQQLGDCLLQSESNY